jgi:dCMP deaminase
MSPADILRLCYRAAAGSPDPSTQNAAILCDHVRGHLIPLEHTLAVNDFPRGVHHHPERWERPNKYAFVEHAERASIYMAARGGVHTTGLIMVCPWAACADCARAIIAAGIRRLITHRQAHDRSPQRWTDSIDVAHLMLAEAGVTIDWHDGQLGDTPPVRHSGELWQP